MSVHEGSKWQEEQERKEKLLKNTPKPKYQWRVLNENNEVLGQYNKKDDAKIASENMRKNAQQMKVDFFCYVERIVI